MQTAFITSSHSASPIAPAANMCNALVVQYAASRRPFGASSGIPEGQGPTCFWQDVSVVVTSLVLTGGHGRYHPRAR